MKKTIAILLAVLMLLGMFTACGKQEAETAAPETAAPETDAPSASKPEATEGESAEALEPVELTWYIGWAQNTTDAEAVSAAITEYLKDTLNVKVKLVFPGDYETQTQMALAAGEDIDICWTGNWGFDYLTNVAKEAFYPLDELLAEYGQGIVELLPEFGLDACKVNGVTYAIPNYQIWVDYNALYITEEAAAKYNYDPTTLTSYKDLEPLMAQIKADNPDSYPLVIGYSANPFTRCRPELNYTEISGIKNVGGVQLDDETCRVVNIYELPQIQEFFQTIYDWNQKGYIRSDSAQMEEEDMVAAMQNGESVMILNTYKPGDEVTQEPRFGQELITAPYGDPVVTTGQVQATLTAITANCKNPERAMMLLNAVNTDPVLYNMLCFGIEGVHYNLQDGYAIPVEGTTYDPKDDWAIGNQFNGYLREGQDANTWEVTKELNDSAIAVPTLGFTFDPSSVSTQIAAVASVVDEYHDTLTNGSLDPDVVYPEFMAKLEAAGVDAVLAEMQTQIDAWLAANK